MGKRGRKSTLTNKDLATLKRMLKAGYSRAEVGEAIGRTPEQVTQIKYSRGIPGRFPKYSKVNPPNSIQTPVRNTRRNNNENNENGNGNLNLKVKSVDSFVQFIQAAKKVGMNINLQLEG